MADTFSEAYRNIRLHCPLAPIMLCRHWAETAYRSICNKRPWSFLRAETEILISDSKSGTCDVTRNSATVNGGTLAYATTDADRQFRVSGGSVYTIITATASAYTLDRPYGGATASGASATVLDAYVSMPTDFQRSLAVLDMANNWQLHLWVTDDELNAWDAKRTASGTPWALATRRLATAGTYTGRVQYELWPYCTSQKNYPHYYIRRPEALTDSTEFLGPLAQFSDIITSYGLVEAARWPGLEGKKNPYFNLTLAQQLKKDADDDLDRLMVLDEEIYMTWLQTVNMNNIPFAPIDSAFWQSHAEAPWPH